MKSITQVAQNDKMVPDSITYFFKKYKISSVLKSANAYKSKGVPILIIFKYLFSTIFTNRSMYMNMIMNTHSAGFAKDTM